MEVSTIERSVSLKTIVDITRNGDSKIMVNIIHLNKSCHVVLFFRCLLDQCHLISSKKWIHMKFIYCKKTGSAGKTKDQEFEPLHLWSGGSFVSTNLIASSRLNQLSSSSVSLTESYPYSDRKLHRDGIIFLGWESKHFFAGTRDL